VLNAKNLLIRRIDQSEERLCFTAIRLFEGLDALLAIRDVARSKGLARS